MNCPMFASNLFRPDMNIAASITQNELDSFQRCCRMSLAELDADKNSTKSRCDSHLKQSVPNLATINKQLNSDLERTGSLPALNESLFENGTYYL